MLKTCLVVCSHHAGFDEREYRSYRKLDYRDGYVCTPFFESRENAMTIILGYWTSFILIGSRSIMVVGCHLVIVSKYTVNASSISPFICIYTWIFISAKNQFILLLGNFKQ